MKGCSSYKMISTYDNNFSPNKTIENAHLHIKTIYHNSIYQTKYSVDCRKFVSDIFYITNNIGLEL